jgi:hypothetical protein
MTYAAIALIWALVSLPPCEAASAGMNRPPFVICRLILLSES